MLGKKRLILPGFLSHDACKELEFIHKSCSTVGYRANVFSTTLAHLIATNCAYLIMPFIPIREKLRESIEDFFDCQLELFIEFTGLISWTKGASIGWHSDDNRPYLKQRQYAAVCYLNNYNEDFKGGLFHFQEGEPTTIVPKIGDAILYTADESNIHCVDEITEGERCTLTLWFTRDSSHNEDAKLISQLSDHLYPFLNPGGVKDTDSDLLMPHGAKKMMMQDSSSIRVEELNDLATVTSRNVSGYLHFSSDFILEHWLPLPASDNMYWVNQDHLMMEEAHDFLVGLKEQHLDFDIRWARMLLLGLEFCFDKDHGNLEECETKMKETNHDCTLYSSDSLDKPLQLQWKGIVLPELFRNSLHAVQVVLFYHWKFWKRPSNCVEDYCYGFGAETATGASTGHRELQTDRYSLLRKVLCKKFTVQDTMLPDFSVDYSASSHEEQPIFNYEDFIQATNGWKQYLCTLSRALLLSLPQWEANKIIFSV
ncbi:hypothetical protein SUGI_0190480 [Cryptomeria japonica]|uniref:uncharacterized protein LOC131078657 isoform X1 n=1 Tax=Cryptomeria japonica TaxID=3369 RepID=UPI002408B60E|nr:uncharacterized protein LOC131078657 isoform X1 [Cryptomeria japonica]GLJ12414.1 hypothetical protein SUGI_0190480 [Cryptomeria japonica]